MDSDLEGIGAAVTGALAARAVEPGHGEGGEALETECANCAMPLVGRHCHYCGQKAHVHRSIGAILHDLIHGVLHLDGKFWRTLPLLAWRPGELTRRYAHGERAKFVSPLGMFLFSVFLMFAIFSAFGLSLANIEMEGPARILSPQSAMVDVEARLAEARTERAAIQRRIDALPGETGTEEARGLLERQAVEIDDRIAHYEEGLETLGSLSDATQPADVDERAESGSIGDTVTQGDGTGESDTTVAEAGGEDEILSGREGFQLIGGDINTGWERLDKGIDKVNENPTLALYKLQANGFKFSWLLIPVSVPFVWILFFWTRRFRLYDHTVFVTYSLAFMSLLVIGLTLLGFVGLPASIITMAAIFVPPIHIFLQLKGAYGLHWLSALLRTILLITFCWITASIFFILLLGIGALG